MWAEDGNKILNCMEADHCFNAASLRNSLEEQGISIDESDLTLLIDNMRSLANQWRTSIGEHGELVFYIDACRAGRIREFGFH